MMLQYFKLLPAILFVFFLIGCVSYQVSDGKVEYVSWNEAQGKVITPIFFADAATFQKLNKWFGVDKAHAYFRADIIQGADATSFEILSGFYSRDRNHAYRRHIRIEGSDAESFEVLGHGFAKDKGNYYFAENKIPVCDYESFLIIDEYLPSRGIDDDCYYHNDTKVDINDRQSLEVLPKYYARTNEEVYWTGHKIKGADPKTFEVMIENRYWVGRDKRYCYSGSQKLECSSIVGDTFDFCRCGEEIDKF